jgi:hypothetical protein
MPFRLAMMGMDTFFRFVYQLQAAFRAQIVIAEFRKKGGRFRTARKVGVHGFTIEY